MGRPEDERQNIPLNAPAGGGGPGRFRIPQPLDVSQLPGGDSSRSSLDSMRFTRTIIEVEVATVAPWTGPLMVGAEFYYRRNLDALQEAAERAIRYVPAAIEAETGQAIQEFIGAILDALIMSAVIVGASSALGATLGGVVGFFFGGAGALPGAAFGAEAGFDLGMYLLEALGLAVLVEHVAGKLGDIASLVGPNLKLAWEAAGKPSLQRAILIDSAAHGLARAIAVLFRLILEGIVLFLLAKGTAKLGELTGKLKASKLGQGFGEWVERNWQKLVDDPRFNPRLKARTPAAGARDGTGKVAEVSSSRREAAQKPLRDGLRLHNREWADVAIKPDSFRPEPPGGSVDLNNATPRQQEAIDALRDQGRRDQVIRQVLESGHDPEVVSLNKGDKLYGFTTAGKGRAASSPYWLTEDQFAEVKSKYESDDVWDRQGVKDYLALPCFNRADAVVSADVTQDAQALSTTINPATETTLYTDEFGKRWIVPDNQMSGGGMQITPPPSAVGNITEAPLP
jgi:hypothetical protein